MEEDMEFYVIVDKNGLYYAKAQKYEYQYTSDVYKAKFYNTPKGTSSIIDHANTYQHKENGHVPLSVKKIVMSIKVE